VRLESLSVSTNLRQKAPLIVRLGRHHFASLHIVGIALAKSHNGIGPHGKPLACQIQQRLFLRQAVLPVGCCLSFGQCLHVADRSDGPFAGNGVRGDQQDLISDELELLLQLIELAFRDRLRSPIPAEYGNDE
jgi:hypothetical protein